MKFFNDLVLDHLTTLRIDRVRDVRVEFRPPFGIFDRPIILQAQATLVAVGRAEVVLRSALGTVRRQFSARHRYKGTAGALDDLQITNNKAVIERDTAKSLEPFSRLFHEFDANLGNLHDRSPYVTGIPRRQLLNA